MKTIIINIPEFICSSSQAWGWFNIIQWCLAGIGLISILWWAIKFIPRGSQRK